MLVFQWTNKDYSTAAPEDQNEDAKTLYYIVLNTCMYNYPKATVELFVLTQAKPKIVFVLKTKDTNLIAMGAPINGFIL